MMSEAASARICFRMEARLRKRRMPVSSYSGGQKGEGSQILLEVACQAP